MKEEETIFMFEVKDLDKNSVSLDKYKGKVSLIVNVASEWGLTDRNYKELVQLHEKYENGISYK